MKLLSFMFTIKYHCCGIKYSISFKGSNVITLGGSQPNSPI